MRLLEHYEILSRSLKETEKEVSITINEISTLLSCSYRNAKIIIHNLQKQKWIEWKPGKGRGNSSTIKLVKSIDQLVLEEAKETITPHSIDESIKLLSKYNIQESLQREFIHWVFHSYLMENKGEETDNLSRLHFPSYRPLPVLDPALVCRRSENHMMRHIFSQLVRYCEETGEFLPNLAHAWEHSENQTKWVFYLQKGVRFHHGKEMTAEDVCYSFLRHKNTSSPYSWILEDINQVTAPHPYTVEFRFRKPCSHFLHLVSSLGGSILPKDNASKKAIPIGTGPYKVVANTKEKLTLSVFHEYFLRRPFLEEISLYFFPKLYDNTMLRLLIS
ncbi:ABC transporter substrate-binding protein [Oceanobacillus kapialis]|uniref:ABC transporter substrate-binding protein n=1 Tax=Oceanobacillus kapialis TaxID=481353 RepID=A0ABW5Q3S2_9BACI